MRFRYLSDKDNKMMKNIIIILLSQQKIIYLLFFGLNHTFHISMDKSECTHLPHLSEDSGENDDHLTYFI